MKYIKKFEGRNTMNWYSRTLYSATLDEFLKYYYKIISNQNVEDVKLFYIPNFTKYGDSYIFAIYTSKKEKEKNFRDMSILSEEYFDKYQKIGSEYTNEEIDEWLKDWDVRQEMNKFNL
jgi:hypothetical protein